jgi:hypothetical protein
MHLRGAAQRPPCLQDPGSYSQTTTRLPSCTAAGLASSALLYLHLGRTRPVIRPKAYLDKVHVVVEAVDWNFVQSIVNTGYKCILKRQFVL